jgi:DNA polymerase elongation subunit (family B)
MTDLLFHILDVAARDEIVVSEDETMKAVSYESGAEENSDMEEMAKRKKFSVNPNGQLVIHLFGSTVDGKHVRVDCKGFEPFFYVRVPEGSKADPVLALKSYLKKAVGEDILNLLSLNLVKKKLMYGYTGNKMFPFVEIRMPSLAIFREVKKVFLNDKQEPSLKYPQHLGSPFNKVAPKIYEANLDPYLRFMHLRNLKPCDWCVVKNGLELADTSTGSIILDDCDWMDVGPCLTPPAPTAPFKVASWDIECWSSSGDFPVAMNGDPVIQIGTVLTTLGSKENEKHIFVLDTCTEIPGATVHCYKTEKALLIGWMQWIVNNSIDILIGYNIFGFDEQYVWHRCEKLGITKMEIIQNLNRLSDYGGTMRLEEKRLSSSAMGDNFLHLWNTTGRLRIDLYHAIKRQYPMGSYKLDDTSRAFLNDRVKKVYPGNDSWSIETSLDALKKQGAETGRAMVLLNETGDSLCEKVTIKDVNVDGGSGRINFEVPEDVDEVDVAKWAIVKDDLSPQEMFKKHKEGPEERATIGAYCIQDCQLVLDMFRKLDTFNNAASMANVCSVPVAHIFLRGQGIKIESLIFKYCHENNLVIEVLSSPGFNASPEDGAAQESYEGAIVLDPIPGLYTTPVGVADFASLYPSTIISENISHDTLVSVKDYDLNGNFVSLSWGAEFSSYDTPESVPFTDIEFDIWGVKDGDSRKNPEKVRKGIRVCRYAQDKQGAIPIIIAQLLDARKKTRALIKTEKDPFKQALLDAQQNAYKITANSLYGQLGSGTFKIRLQNLAASVTAYGRKQIMFAKAAIEKFYGPGSGNPKCCADEVKTVYGDSVKGDTPLFIRRNGVVELVRIDELCASGWESWHDTKEAIDLKGIETWTERGWTRLDRLIRHKLAPGKKLFRVLTHSGVVDCTEDHSLVAANGKEVKPTEVHVGTELLHSFEIHKEFGGQSSAISKDEAWAMGFFLADGSADTYTTNTGLKSTWAINKADIALLELAQQRLPFETKILDTLASSGVYKLVPVGDIRSQATKYRDLFYNHAREKRVPSFILNATLDVCKAFLDGFYAGDGDKSDGNMRWDQKGKEVSTGLMILANRLGYTTSVNDRSSKPDVFRITCTKSYQRKNPIAIKKIYEISSDGIDYVYDLQTENHHFAVGPGNLIVHNTDSLFISFNPKDPVTGKKLEGIEAVKATIEITEEAGKLVTQALKYPHDFEFDKVYWPFLIFSKKRYVGNKYEDADHYVQTSMGIALKRRDYAPIVKKIYGGAIQILLTEKNVAKAAEFVRSSCKELVDGKYGLGPLTITKSLRAEYANPSGVAHKVLADRISIRSPGNAPAAGDRIGFVYVQPAVGQKAADLQGDRIETPAYIREKGLKPDYMFYIDHQISNPVCQVFGLLIEQVPGYTHRIWSENPDVEAKEREALAYKLLFQDVIYANTNTAKKNFIQLFGGVEKNKEMVEETQGTHTQRTQKSPVVAKTVSVSGHKPIKQSSLDSFFTDSLRMEARQATLRKQTAAEKALSKKKETTK